MDEFDDHFEKLIADGNSYTDGKFICFINDETHKKWQNKDTGCLLLGPTPTPTDVDVGMTVILVYRLVRK